MLFEIGALLIGVDEDGEEITVPIARPAELTSSLLAKVAEPAKPSGESDTRAIEILRVLATLRSKAPATYHEPRALAQMVGEGFEAVRSNPDSLRKAVKRALVALIGAGKAETDGNGGYRAAHSAKPQPEPEDKTIH